jgi:hypothetical protein
MHLVQKIATARLDFYQMELNVEEIHLEMQVVDISIWHLQKIH